MTTTVAESIGYRSMTEPRHSDLDALLRRVARSDADAFAALYDHTRSRVYGLVARVLRDSGYSEETTQEIYLEVWRTADAYDSAKGSALSWLMTMAHRRAVDRVRSAVAATEREHRTAQPLTADDEVAETAVANLDAERVRRCLGGLTDVQRESITLAYYGGYTYPEVAGLLHAALGTVKTRIRDGLIRLRDCMGVSW